MKKTFLFFTLFTVQVFSQVGVNTIKPQATLDVEGNARIAITDELEKSPEYILAIDENQIVRKVLRSSLKGGAVVVQSRVYAIIPKNEDQLLKHKGDTYKVTFDGSISGINTSFLSISSDKTSINFPPNRAFKITGMIGVRGKKKTISSKSNPGYIASHFVAGPGSKQIISTQGYSESSTEKFDDGGVTNPIIIFTTGESGGSVQLEARFGGGEAGENDYYLAGAPTSSSIGTYFIIEEL